MGETEVRSPVCRPGSKVGSGSGQSLSPGARSNPSRSDLRRDQAPDEPPPQRHHEPEPGQARIVGPNAHRPSED